MKRPHGKHARRRQSFGKLAGPVLALGFGLSLAAPTGTASAHDWSDYISDADYAAASADSGYIDAASADSYYDPCWSDGWNWYC